MTPDCPATVIEITRSALSQYVGAHLNSPALGLIAVHVSGALQQALWLEPLGRDQILTVGYCVHDVLEGVRGQTLTDEILKERSANIAASLVANFGIESLEPTQPYAAPMTKEARG